MTQLGISMGANFSITKWWTVNLYLNAYNNHYVGLYNNDPVDLRLTTLTGNMNNSFSLGKGWNAEINGWFRTKGQEGLLISNPMGSVNTGLTKQILNKKGTIKVGVSDIFHTQQFSGLARYSDVDVRVANTRDSRQFKVAFTYKFGKTNIAPERRKNGGAGDEQNRVKGGGGN